MRSAWAHWVAITSHREPGTSLALFRIAIGACAFGMIGWVVIHDLVTLLWIDEAYGGFRPIPSPPWLVTLLGGANPTTVWGMVIAGLISSAALALGVGGRFSALATLFLLGNLTEINDNASGSYDELIENALWILFLADNDATLSLRARLRTGAWVDDTPVAAWPRYLGILQLFLVYWTTGVQKVSSFWTPGGDFSALYYILQQPTWQRFDMEWVAWLFPFTQLATAVTWFWEVLTPLWLLAFWYRYTHDRPGRLRAAFNRWDVRFWFAFLGDIFHLLILIFMDVGPFSLVSWSYYACLWHPDEWRSIAGRVMARLGRAPPGPSAAGSG